MKKLTDENLNTPQRYNRALMNHLKKKGQDYDEEERMNALLNAFQEGKLLDVACGISLICPMAKKKNPESEIWGLDFAFEVISWLKKEYSNINYVSGNIKELPFRDEYFDYIIAGEILEHTMVPQDFLKEIFRVLKKGGQLALSTPFGEGHGKVIKTADGELILKTPLEEKDWRKSPCSPEHIWGFEKEDMYILLKPFGVVDTFILEARHQPRIIIANCIKNL